MTDSNSIKDDLNFIKSTLEGSDVSNAVPSIYFVWGLIVPIGFMLADFFPALTGKYWMFAGPIGGLLSAYFGRKYAREIGQQDNSDAKKNIIHWGSMLLVIGMATMLVSNGLMSGKALGAVVLLIVGMSYILAGNYIDKNLRIFGIIMLAGYYPIVNKTSYTWSFIGLVVGVGLIALGIKTVQDQKGN